MYKKHKKNLPIKYMRKGLFSEEDFENLSTKNKIKRRQKKPKISVHIKTGLKKVK